MTINTIITLTKEGIGMPDTMPRACDMPLGAWAWTGKTIWQVGHSPQMKHQWKPRRHMPKQIRVAALIMGLRVPA